MTAVLPARPSAAERRAAPSLAAAVRDLDRRRARSRQRMILPRCGFWSSEPLASVATNRSPFGAASRHTGYDTCGGAA